MISSKVETKYSNGFTKIAELFSDKLTSLTEKTFDIEIEQSGFDFRFLCKYQNWRGIVPFDMMTFQISGWEVAIEQMAVFLAELYKKQTSNDNQETSKTNG